MPQVARRVENCDAYLLTFDRAGVIDPARRLAPDLFSSYSIAIGRLAQPVEVAHRRMFFEPEVRMGANGHQPLFGVAQFNRAMRCAEGCCNINCPGIRNVRKRKDRCVGADRLTISAYPEVVRDDHRSTIFTFCESHPLVFDIAGFVPEVSAVNIVVRKPDRLVVWMVFCLSGNPIGDGPRSGHRYPAGSKDRVEDRFFVALVVVLGEYVAIDHYLDLAVARIEGNRVFVLSGPEDRWTKGNRKRGERYGM